MEDLLINKRPKKGQLVRLNFKTSGLYGFRDYMLVIWPNDELSDELYDNNGKFKPYCKLFSSIKIPFGINLAGNFTSNIGLYDLDSITKPTFDDYWECYMKLQNSKNYL